MNIGVQDGLLDPKHEKAMGSAVWLFLWCIRCETQKSGFVLGGMPLTYAEISRRSRFPERKLRRWMNRLRKYRYISVTHTNYCYMRIEVMKAKKWFPKQPSLQFSNPRPETVNLTRPEAVNTETKNGQLNKSSSLRENYKTPLPPAGAGDEENFVDYYGTVIAVKMGRHRNLPKTNGGKMFAPYYVEFLNNKGFPARIIEKE